MMERDETRSFDSLDTSSKEYITNYGLRPPQLGMDDVVWQHMPFKYFNALLCNQALFCKSIESYDTINAEFYPTIDLTTYLQTSDPKQYLQNMMLFEALKKITYLSCWYRDANLSDTIFLRFAGAQGVAVKSRVSKLIDALYSFSDVTEGMSPHYGVLQYIPSSLLHFKATIPHLDKNSLGFNTIIPYFYKDVDFADEKELRLLIRNQKAMPANGTGKTHTSLQIPISIYETIEAIAIKTTSHNRLLLEEKLHTEGYRIGSIEAAPGGYTVYELKKGDA